MLCAVFDLDGTLADTSGDLLAAANAQFLSAGYNAPLTQEQHRQIALRGGRAMLRAGAALLGIANVDDFADANYKQLLAHYDENLDELTTLYPDVVEVLDQLKADGWTLAVCTNKPTYMAEKLLLALGIADYFGNLIGAGSLDVVKPDAQMMEATLVPLGVEAKDAVLIGDSDTDFHTAKNSGTDIVLVDFDGTGIARQFPDTITVGSYAELYKILSAKK